MKVMDPGPRFEEHIITPHSFVCEHCNLRYVEEDKLRKHRKSHQKGKVKEKRDEVQSGVKERRVADGVKLEEHEVHLLSTAKGVSVKSANKPMGPKKAGQALQAPKSSEDVGRKSVESVLVVSEYWKCINCEAPFKTEKEMGSHQEKVHAQSCSDCRMKFITAIDLRRHQVERHNVVSKTIIKCKLCGEATESKSVAGHKKAKHAYKCVLCNLEFVLKAKLWKHMIEEHHQGTWVNKPAAGVSSKKPSSTKSREAPPSIQKLLEGGRAMEAVIRKEERTIPKKIAKLKEAKWETVKDKKERADESREKVRKRTSAGKASTSGATSSNTVVKAAITEVNTFAKATNAEAKSINPGATATSTVAKATGLAVKEKATSTEVKAPDSEARAGEKKHLNKAADRESETLEECRMCKEVCSPFFSHIFAFL